MIDDDSILESIRAHIDMGFILGYPHQTFLIAKLDEARKQNTDLQKVLGISQVNERDLIAQLKEAREALGEAAGALTRAAEEFKDNRMPETGKIYELEADEARKAQGEE